MTERLRTYGDGCATAHALDLIGERWALLIVRELLFGPKRFSDLQTGLHHASPNVLSQRLRELDGAGIVRRHRLGPPASAWVYDLTDWGRELKPILVQLSRWGSRSPSIEAGGALSVDSLLLALEVHFDGARAADLDATVEVVVDEEVFAVRTTAGRIQISRGSPASPDATFRTDAETFRSIVIHGKRPKRLTTTGDAETVRRLLDARSGGPFPLTA